MFNHVFLIFHGEISCKTHHLLLLQGTQGWPLRAPGRSERSARRSHRRRKGGEGRRAGARARGGGAPEQLQIFDYYLGQFMSL